MTLSMGSVSAWIDDLKRGNRRATHELWQRYFQVLLEFVRKKFRNFPRRMADEEDVVACTLASFFSDVEDGRLPDLHDREAAWRLLVVKTSQKVLDCIRAENAVKRQRVERNRTPDATPAALAEMADLCAWLLKCLGDDSQGEVLRQIAVWKMEGYTTAEIASKMSVSGRTVERKLDLIRQSWEQEFAHATHR